MERHKRRRRKGSSRVKNNNKRRKKQVVVDTTIQDLPNSIIGHILSRLPIRTILNCGTVCEPWRKVFLDPDFPNQVPLFKSLSHTFILRSNKHVLRTNPRKLCLFNLPETFSPTTTRYSFDDRADVLLNFKHDFGIPTTIGNDFELVNSCNGFLCLCDSQLRYPTYILNPITGEYIKLPLDVPENEVTKTGSKCYVDSRIGFSPRTNQYKVIRCFVYSHNKSRIEIHTLGTGMWRRIEGRTWNLFSDQTYYDPFLNGSLHWLVPDYGDFTELIWSFNFDDEKFQSVPPPSSLCQLDYDRIGQNFLGCLGIMGGRLSLTTYGEFLNIWVMEDYGVHDSWTKQFVISLGQFSHIHFQPLWNDAELFVLYDGGALFSCYKSRKDLSIVKFENIKIYGIKNFQLVALTPSFVSFRDIAMGENLKVFRVNMRKRW